MEYKIILNERDSESEDNKQKKKIKKKSKNIINEGKINDSDS